MDKTFGFIILRHVNNEITNEYWMHSYDCIRKFYPTNNIIIIDDNSDYLFITNKKMCNVTIINNEFPKRGELMPYYYYLKNKLFDVAIIIHDSMFINKHINFFDDFTNYKFLWDFEHNWDQIEDETIMIEQFKNDELMKFYRDKNLWKGCFGGTMIISHDFLCQINEKYDLSKLINYVNTRYNRCSFERVIACLMQIEYPRSVLFGNIHNYCKWGITFKNKNKHKNLPIIKVWTGR